MDEVVVTSTAGADHLAAALGLTLALNKCSFEVRKVSFRSVPEVVSGNWTALVDGG